MYLRINGNLYPQIYMYGQEISFIAELFTIAKVVWLASLVVVLSLAYTNLFSPYLRVIGNNLICTRATKEPKTHRRAKYI